MASIVGAQTFVPTITSEFIELSSTEAAALIGGDIDKCCGPAQHCFKEETCPTENFAACDHHQEDVSTGANNTACNITKVGTLCTQTPGTVPKCRTSYQCEWDDELGCFGTGPEVDVQYGFQTCSPAC